MDMAQIEKERLAFEKFKFYFQIVVIAATIVSTFIGAFVTISNYVDGKKRENDELYFKNLANLESNDPNIQKASLLELCGFRDKYETTIPILMDFLEKHKNEGNVALEQTLLTTFFLIGEPMVQELAQENINSFEKNEQRFKAVQWAIVELIKKDIGNKLFYVDFQGIYLDDVDLKNIVISNYNLKGTTLTNVNFNGANIRDINLSEAKFKSCQFWNTSFGQNSDLKNATFYKCSLKDTLFECDLTDAIFPESECKDIVITNDSFISKKTFLKAPSCLLGIKKKNSAESL